MPLYLVTLYIAALNKQHILCKPRVLTIESIIGTHIERQQLVSITNRFIVSETALIKFTRDCSLSIIFTIKQHCSSQVIVDGRGQGRHAVLVGKFSLKYVQIQHYSIFGNQLAENVDAPDTVCKVTRYKVKSILN